MINETVNLTYINDFGQLVDAPKNAEVENIVQVWYADISKSHTQEEALGLLAHGLGLSFTGEISLSLFEEKLSEMADSALPGVTMFTVTGVNEFADRPGKMWSPLFAALREVSELWDKKTGYEKRLALYADSDLD